MSHTNPSFWKSAFSKLHHSLVLNRRTSRIAIRIADLLPPNVSVLDVGSGNGRLARIIMDRRPDVKIHGLEVLKWPEQQIETSLYDGLAIPFERDAWDFCLACDVLHHSHAPEKLFAELVRVSKRGIVVKEHNSDSFVAFITLCIMDWVGNRGHGVGLTYNYFSSHRWRNVFESSELRIERMDSNLKLYPIPFRWVFDRNLHFIAIMSFR